MDLYKPKALGEPLEQFDKGPYTLAKARGEALEFLRPSNPPVLTDAQARREDGMIRARRR